MLGMIDNSYGTVFVLDGAFIVAEMFRGKVVVTISKIAQKRDRFLNGAGDIKAAGNPQPRALADAPASLSGTLHPKGAVSLMGETPTARVESAL